MLPNAHQVGPRFTRSLPQTVHPRTVNSRHRCRAVPLQHKTHQIRHLHGRQTIMGVGLQGEDVSQRVNSRKLTCAGQSAKERRLYMICADCP